MSNREAYLFYEAGQAVAAAHLGLKIRHISPDPAAALTHIELPPDTAKPRIILWLTGMAAEKKGLGRSDPLRRTRNRQRVQALILAATRKLPLPERAAAAAQLRNQAQDRANAICAELLDAIQQVAALLRDGEPLPGDKVVQIVLDVKARRAQLGQHNPDEVPDQDPETDGQPAWVPAL